MLTLFSNLRKFPHIFHICKIQSNGIVEAKCPKFLRGIQGCGRVSYPAHTHSMLMCRDCAFESAQPTKTHDCHGMTQHTMAVLCIPTTVRYTYHAETKGISQTENILPLAYAARTANNHFDGYGTSGAAAGRRIKCQFVA